MMKWTHVCPLLGVALLACATGENQDPEPLGLGSAGSDLSNTSQDFAAPVIESADGVTGSIVVPVVPAKTGQYLTVRQTGADAVGDIAWWSLHEVSIACK